MKRMLPNRNVLRSLTSIIFVFCLWASAHASYMKDVPMKLTQPDGEILSCFATGNEFHNWLHDENNYTIIKNPATGYYVYAIRVNTKITSSGHIAGRSDPAALGLTPGINLTEAEVDQKTQELKAEKAIPQSNLRTTEAQPVRPATGVYNNLVVFISFSDQGEITLPMSTITSKFNALGTPSVRDFYKEVSNSQLDLVSSFYPVSAGTYPVSYKDSKPRSYYTKDAPDGYANGNPDATTREHTLLANAVRAVQNQVPANLLIDGDNDGNIDNIVFVINGYNEAWSDLLWPHRWSLFSQTVKINNKRAYDYNIVFSEALGVGVICHELFHSFGAPDLYHYTDYPHEPSGDWDLMSGGDWNSPRHMTVYLKQRYANWSASIPVLTNAGRYSLAPVSRSSFAAYRINLPNTDQYLVLEYRKKEGRYEAALSGEEGLLIYRINPTINGNGDNGPEELYVFRPNGTNTVNGNLNQATFSQNKNRVRFDDASNPSCFLANGAAGGLPANLGITNVSIIGDVISFDYKGGTGNNVPTVALTAPLNNASFTALATITITANANDADGTVSKVDFYNGSVLLGTDATAPYSFTWNAVTAGAYTITAKATDNAGAVNTSSTVAVTVVNPVCTLANTLLNTTNYIGTSGSWTGTTADTKDKSFDGDINTSFDALTNDVAWTGLDLVSNKKITGIRFYPRRGSEARMIGGKFQGSSSPDFSVGVVDLYTVTATPPLMWNCVNISNTGSYRYVRYIAPINAHGNVSEVEFYGTSAANVLPVISLTAPANNTNYTAPAAIAITANASDADGTISKVEFYSGTILIGTDVTAPYSFAWSPVAAGAYSITAKATDNSGAAVMSAIASVTVLNAVCTLTNTLLNTTNYIGTNGSWTGTLADTKDRSYDGDINTSFDALSEDVSWSGLDLVMNKKITGIRFYPRRGFEARMVGGKFQGSSSPDFSVGVVDLYTVTATPALMWNCIPVSNTGAYRYVRYVGPVNSHANVSEVEFYGTAVAGNILPVVSLTAPANNAAYSAPATVSITANASDADGSVSKVEFYNGSVLLGTDATAPYTFTWSSVNAGTYAITAKATDNSGAVATSTAISIIVNAVVSMDDIVGEACGQNGTNATYNLNTINRGNAVSYNWWFTGSAQSVTTVANQPYNVVMAYGNTFTSGQLCVGVNYNVAPWYKQYCKNVSACPSNINGFRADETEAVTVASPNPSTEAFKLTLKKAANTITVLDSKGVVVKRFSDVSGTVEFGIEWYSGMYTVSIVYTDNTTENIRVVKI